MICKKASHNRKMIKRTHFCHSIFFYIELDSYLSMLVLNLYIISQYSIDIQTSGKKVRYFYAIMIKSTQNYDKKYTAISC